MPKTPIQRGHFCWLPMLGALSVLVRVMSTNHSENRARCMDADGVWHEVAVSELTLADAKSIQEVLNCHSSHSHSKDRIDWDAAKFIAAGHHKLDPRALDDTCWCYIRGETWPEIPLGKWCRVAQVKPNGCLKFISKNDRFGRPITRSLRPGCSDIWAVAAGLAMPVARWKPERTPLIRLRSRWLL